MNADSKLARLVLVSPWTLLVFLLVPLLVILSFSLHVTLPMPGTAPLLVNNICFALLAACRFLHHLARLRGNVRYGEAFGRPRKGAAVAAPVARVRGELASAGYSFTTGSGYGEKRDLGYLGSTALYGGLCLLLAVGSWDNLRHFSGALLDGMGPSTNLAKAESYRVLNKGPLAPAIDSLPKMQIVSQTLPDRNYPKGATEIALMSEDGKGVSGTLVPGVPMHYGGFDIYMTKLVFQPQIVVKYRDGGTLFDDLVTLDPLVERRGPYSFYGLFQGTILGGGVYFQPERNMLMVVFSQGGKKVVTDLAFQVDKQAVQGDYVLSCTKLGQWSEIEVVHRRHRGLLAVGGMLAVLGLVLRIVIRPQRVWLEESPEGCTLRAIGGEAKRILKL